MEDIGTAFHAMLDTMTDATWNQPSLNPGWTNGEIVIHMIFGYVIFIPLLPMARAWGRLPRGSSRWFADLLNAITGPFNWVNKVGARMQGKFFTRKQVGPIFDWVHGILLKQMASIREEEWPRGMYYPTRWDSNFSDFMTLELQFRYAATHFNFHLGQLSR